MSIYGKLKPYIQIARVDHWFKNVFMLPGVVLVLFDDPSLMGINLFWQLFIAFIATGLVASSNYVVNEILDAPQDALHPVKKLRPVPSGQVNVLFGYLEWLLLAVLGLTLSWTLGILFFYSALTLWIMGCLYNIPPVRTKDKPYLDVLSESVNNPLRLLLGWYGVGAVKFPSLSLIMAYWMIGAFFMAVKRFAEYRRIGDPAIAASYRASFSHYNEERLLTSIIYYAVAFGFFFGIFLIRYRIELLVSIPFLAGFISYYIHIGFHEDSPVQYPERLYKHTGFVVYAAFCAVLMTALMFIDIPVIDSIFTPTLQTQ